MTCKYCTPNKRGQRKPLAINTYPLRNKYNGPSLDRYKRNVLKINRNRNNKRKYFLGLHSMDLTDNGTMLRNNGFLFTKEINFCPICGRDLKAGVKP